ncbi:UDP-N-acetylglucosamine transferase subunit [Podila humilis]|nr:UDP-N-acetylglucosamine transferase subunit [Podila humilis]
MDTRNAFQLTLAAVITLALISLPLAFIVAFRLRISLPPHRPNRHPKASSASVRTSSRCTTTIFLGSGGHTAEMLQLVSGLDPQKYTPRHYVVGWDDEASVEKVHRLESSRGEHACEFDSAIRNSRMVPGFTDHTGYTINRIPRSRFVGQSFLTTPFTLLKSFSIALPMIKRLTCLSLDETPSCTAIPACGSVGTSVQGRRSVLLMNGPGTCFALALAVIGGRMAGVPDIQTPELIFIESFARVSSLSLAGKLLYPLCDHFLVQWPALQQRYPRAEHIGILV